MIKRTMFFVDEFDSEFKEKHYKIFRFVDVDNLSIYTGTNIDGKFIKGKAYTCDLEYKNKKMVVVSAE